MDLQARDTRLVACIWRPDVHRGDMLRFLLLRVLPRRLFPVLLAFEAFRLIRRWRSRNDPVPRDATVRVSTQRDAILAPSPDPDLAPTEIVVT